MPHLTQFLVACFIVTTSGLSTIFDDKSKQGSPLTVDVESVLSDATGLLKTSRAFRTASYHGVPGTPHHYPKLTGDALRLLIRAKDYVSAFRKGDLPKLATNPAARDWFNMMKGKARKQMKREGGNKRGRKAVAQKFDVNATLMGIGFAIDTVDIGVLIATAFMPNISFVAEPVVFWTWWGVGLMVFMSEGGMNFLEAGYALMQMPTTIGFGDMLPESEQYGLKLFHAIHIFVSSVFLSGRVNYYIDYVLDFFDEKLGMEEPKQKLLTSGITLLVEALFSTFYFAYEFNKVSGQDYTYDLVDSFYMTVIGLSTVGYGDFSPGMDGYKRVGPAPFILGFFWGHFGTETLARFMDNWDQLRHTVEDRALIIENPDTGASETIMTGMKIDDVESAAIGTTTGA